MLRKFIRIAGVSAVLTSVLSAAPSSIPHAKAAEATTIARPNIPLVQPVQETPVAALGQFYRGTDNALKEFGAARSDHAAIALDIAQCYYETIGDPMHWSPSIRAILLSELDEHRMQTPPFVTHKPTEGSTAHTLPVLNPFHAAAISFSDRISRDRLEVRRELEDSRSRSRLYQILILGFGACATIFVSIRTVIPGNTPKAGFIGVMAIVFSTAGAAVSSMSGFDGSQIVALRDQRTLSQLQQLHWRVASDVLKRPNLCKEPAAFSDDAMEVVDAWRTRLEAILDSAVETMAKPGDLSGGRPQAPTTQPKGEPARTAAIEQ